MELKTADVGTVLYARYGYDQTNYTFYQITERRGESTMVLRRLKTDSRPEGWACDIVRPLRNQFTDHPPITRRVGKHGYAKAEAHEYLHVWDGKPKRATSYA